MGIEIRQLKYFLIVAEELHFTRAAKRLNMTQPPLSQQIKQLENKLKVQLFNRFRKKITLTTAGEHFKEEVPKILNQLTDLQNETRHIHNGKVGTLKIAHNSGVGIEFVDWIFHVYKKNFPDIHISLQQKSSSEVLKGIEKKNIHLGFTVSPKSNENVNHLILKEISFYVALPHMHRLATSAEPLLARELWKEEFIMTPRYIGPDYYDAIIGGCYKEGFSPNITNEAHELQTIIRLVGYDLGISILPESMINPKENKEVFFRPLNKDFSKLDIALVWNKENNTPIVKSFVNSIKKSYS